MGHPGVTELARSFGRIAADYDAVRPEYAPEALARAVELLELGPDARVVDLAAGTGTLARPLAERFPRLVAVEPDDEMRAVLAARSPGVELLAGAAERIPLPDDSADAVFVGDAFHWFDGPEAVAEILRILQPAGGVALLWNLWWEDGDDGTTDSLDPPLPPDARALCDDIYVRSGRAAARAEKADPAVCFADSPLGALEVEYFERTEELSGAEVVDLYTTTSAVASLPAPDREEHKRKLSALLEPAYRLRITTILQWGRLA
jgi:ubiquinone/menaquinone biosynthesis C-methylase UbiE